MERYSKLSPKDFDFILQKKKLFPLLRGINLVSELLSFIQNKKLQWHKKVCENKDFIGATIPFEETKILESNQCQKSDKKYY